jgi:hypothetical protein
MSLEATDLSTIDALYAFVEGAVPKTGLLLNEDAPYRPWSCMVSSACQDIRWVYPSRPLPSQLLQHLANFAHRPLPNKGFVLFEMGRVVKVIDVDAVDGSSRPDRLAPLVQEAFTAKPRSRRRDLFAGLQGNPLDPYQVLGANEMDSEEEIKKKYKQMVLQYHPDRVAHLGPELKDLAAKKTTEINTAYGAIRRLRGF